MSVPINQLRWDLFTTQINRGAENQPIAKLEGCPADAVQFPTKVDVLGFVFDANKEEIEYVMFRASGKACFGFSLRDEFWLSPERAAAIYGNSDSQMKTLG